MSDGRGTWPSSGLGGTLAYSSDLPGMYYKVPFSSTNYIGKNADLTDMNQRAVVLAIKAYQTALGKRLGSAIIVDGVFGPGTKAAVVEFQNRVKITADGVIGPTTSKMLICPDLQDVYRAKIALYPSLRMITPQIICGTMKQESNFDVGAVGIPDSNDKGPGQISLVNHPEYTEEQAFQPPTAFEFMFNYYKTSINDSRINTVDDMIASYNLGVGGAARWISQGRPVDYYPVGYTTPRHPWSYINNIKAGCALPPR